MNYAIDYAPKEKTRVLRWKDGKEPEIIDLTTRKEKLEFLKTIGEDDQIYSELGGGGDTFTLAALKRGVNIFRIPPFKVKELREEKGIPKEESAEAIMILAIKQPGLFYPVRELDKQIIKLRIFTRYYLMVQKKVRIPAELRFQAIYRDLYLIQEGQGLDEETYLKTKLAQNPIFTGTRQVEKEYLEKIKELLPQIPVYCEIFEPIKGCGSVISGICIAEIADIRRFSTPHKLVAYAGYHIEAVQRELREGKPEDWNHNLPHAVWLFTHETVDKLSPERSEWKKLLLERKKTELERHPEFPPYYIKKRAARWLGRKFLHHIWREWTKLA